jgi:hypothetical protein
MPDADGCGWWQRARLAARAVAAVGGGIRRAGAARCLIYTIETTKAASACFYSCFDIFSQNSSNFEQKKIDGEPPLCYNEVTTQSL